MIVNGNIVVYKKKFANSKKQAIDSVCDGVYEIAKRHDWVFDNRKVSAIAEEFVNKHYLEFNEKQNGNKTYPLNRLEEWMIRKKHKNRENIDD